MVEKVGQNDQRTNKMKLHGVIRKWALCTSMSNKPHRQALLQRHCDPTFMKTKYVEGKFARYRRSKDSERIFRDCKSVREFLACESRRKRVQFLASKAMSLLGNFYGIPLLRYFVASSIRFNFVFVTLRRVFHVRRTKRGRY